MIELLNGIDNELFLMLHSLFRSGFLDIFMKMFSGRWVWVPFYLSIAVMAMISRRDWWRFGAFLIAAALAITITDQVCASLIRPYVARLRPSNPDNPISSMVMIVNGYRGGSYGFPSCHAANSLALAFFMSLAVKKRSFTALIFGWAIINSLSRVYLGVHYPGDLLVGGIIGSAVGAGCYFIYTKATGMVKPMQYRWLPAAVAGVTVIVIAIVAAIG